MVSVQDSVILHVLRMCNIEGLALQPKYFIGRLKLVLSIVRSWFVNCLDLHRVQF